MRVPLLLPQVAQHQCPVRSWHRVRIPFPAMSGATLERARRPPGLATVAPGVDASPPTNPAQISQTMSPNRFVVRAHRRLGLDDDCMHIASTIIPEGISGSPVPPPATFRNRPSVIFRMFALCTAVNPRRPCAVRTRTRSDHPFGSSRVISGSPPRQSGPPRARYLRKPLRVLSTTSRSTCGESRAAGSVSAGRTSHRDERLAKSRR